MWGRWVRLVSRGCLLRTVVLGRRFPPFLLDASGVSLRPFEPHGDDEVGTVI